MALQNYADEWKSFPPAYALQDGQPAASWRVQILPMVEQREVYDRYRLDEPWDSVFNRRLADEFAADSSMFRCPSAPAVQVRAFTNYVMPVGAGAISKGAQGATFRDFRNGTSKTIAVAEIAPTNIYWNEPRDLPFDRMSFRLNDPTKPSISSPHSGGVTVVFADGHAQSLSSDIDPEVLKAMLTIQGGEKIQVDW